MKRSGAAETSDRPREKGSLDRAVIVATALKLLDNLTEAEIAAKLPVQLRHLPEAVAA